MTRSPLWLTLLRLGHRCGRGTGGEGLVHRVAVAIAAAVALLTAWLFIACTTVYQQRDARMAARSPHFAAAADARDVVAWWRDGMDTAHSRQFAVVTLIPLRDSAPPPPGLDRWPRPGEAFISPQLAALDVSGNLRQRYGAVVGLIGENGLADPTEFLVYRRPIATTLPTPERDQGFLGIRGFGAAEPYGLANHVTDFPLSAAIKALLVLVLPASALLLIAARTGAQRRDGRLAMLDALGAPTRARAWVVLGEAVLPASVGIAIGACVAWLTTLVNVTLPFSGYVVRANDLAHARTELLQATIVVLLAVLGVVVAVQIRRRTRAGNRPAAVVPKIRRWPAAVFAAAVVLAALGALARGNEGRFMYALGMLIALAALPVVAGWLTSLLGRVVAERGNRRGRPSAVVGGRWLSARPAVIARTGAVFVISLGLASQAQVIQSQLTAVGQAGSRLQRVVGDTMVQLNASPIFPQELEQFSRTFDQQRLLRIYHEELPQDPNSGGYEYGVRTVVVGAPGALAALGSLATAPRVPTPATEAYDELGPGWDRLLQIGVLQTGAILRSDTMKHPERLLVSTTAPKTGTFDTAVVLNSNGSAGVEQIKRAAFTTLVAPNVSVAADDFQAAASSYADLVHWLLDFGLVAMAMLILGGTIASAGVFVAQSRELGPLSAFRADRGLFHGIAAWNLTVPLIAVSLIGTVTASGLALLLTRLTPYGRLSVPFLLLCLGMTVVAAVGVGVGCGEVATRSARAWRPSGE